VAAGEVPSVVPLMEEQLALSAKSLCLLPGNLASLSKLQVSQVRGRPTSRVSVPGADSAARQEPEVRLWGAWVCGMVCGIKTQGPVEPAVPKMRSS
jgi:hypothetical protein